jgi:hypothetical protein
MLQWYVSWANYKGNPRLLPSEQNLQHGKKPTKLVLSECPGLPDANRPRALRCLEIVLTSATAGFLSALPTVVLGRPTR